MLRFLKKRTKGENFEIRNCENSGREILIAKGGWDSVHGEILEEREIKGVRLVCPGPKIDFLTNLPQLLSIEIYGSAIEDISPVEAHEGLKLLGLPYKFGPQLDVCDFPELEVLKGEWTSSLKGFERCASLRHLNLPKYPHADLSPLSSLARLEELLLVSSKLTSLSGILELGSLRRLDLYNCPNLASAEGLTEHPSLDSVKLERCGVELPK